ncbi:hypothetical protein O181_018392 [Austropuccinia psidii MF-1]|uniref:Uncharacterized protein n=1 Tax=Austropuccinia psidii MF-1 TaxID=1389203 RepID=A0A9Q3GTH1_9BASI|nr:hypothetical protein [Austropuccinia psidii MF-1]
MFFHAKCQMSTSSEMTRSNTLSNMKNMELQETGQPPHRYAQFIQDLMTSRSLMDTVFAGTPERFLTSEGKPGVTMKSSGTVTSEEYHSGSFNGGSYSKRVLRHSEASVRSTVLDHRQPGINLYGRNLQELGRKLGLSPGAPTEALQSMMHFVLEHEPVQRNHNRITIEDITSPTIVAQESKGPSKAYEAEKTETNSALSTLAIEFQPISGSGKKIPELSNESHSSAIDRQNENPQKEPEGDEKIQFTDFKAIMVNRWKASIKDLNRFAEFYKKINGWENLERLLSQPIGAYRVKDEGFYDKKALCGAYIEWLSQKKSSSPLNVDPKRPGIVLTAEKIAESMDHMTLHEIVDTMSMNPTVKKYFIQFAISKGYKQNTFTTNIPQSKKNLNQLYEDWKLTPKSMGFEWLNFWEKIREFFKFSLSKMKMS